MNDEKTAELDLSNKSIGQKALGPEHALLLAHKLKVQAQQVQICIAVHEHKHIFL